MIKWQAFTYVALLAFAIQLTACTTPRLPERPIDRPIVGTISKNQNNRLYSAPIPPQPSVPPVSTPAPPPILPETTAPNLPIETSALPAVQASSRKAALLLPLSSSDKKLASLAEAMLNTAQLAVADSGDNNFELLPQDTGGTPQGAVQAAQKAMADGAQIILGPLLSTETKAVKENLALDHLPIISFSTDVKVAGNGVYVMGFLPQSEIFTLLAYAAGHGVKNLAILAPKTPYGDLVVNSAMQAAGRYNMAITANLRYEKAGEETANQLKNIASQPLDALLIPAGGDELKLIAKQARGGLLSNNVRLLGSGLWDDNSIWLENALQGAWYAGIDSNPRTSIANRFQQENNSTMPRLATLAYDATGLAATLARGVSTNNPFNSATINNANGYAGVDGVFRFQVNGLVERRLGIVEIQGNGVRIIETPATSFMQPSG